MDQQQTTTQQINIDQPTINPDPMTGSVTPVTYEGSMQNLVDDMLNKYPETDNKKEEEAKEDESTKSEKKSETKEEKKTDTEDTKSEEKLDEDVEDEENLYDASESDDIEKPDLVELPNTPEEYIAEKLPTIQTTIIVDGQPKVVQVKVPAQLPPNVEFASKNEELNFITSMAEQTNRAENLKNEYLNIQQQNQIAQFQQAERLEIKEDIASLQKEGLLPKFTRNVPVEEDPKAELAREVLKFYEQENDRRIDQANRLGRPFSRITYKDAFSLYRQIHPEPKVESKELKEEDEARKSKVKETARVNKTQGGDAGKGQDNPLPQTRRLSDLVRFL